MYVGCTFVLLQCYKSFLSFRLILLCDACERLFIFFIYTDQNIPTVKVVIQSTLIEIDICQPWSQVLM